MSWTSDSGYLQVNQSSPRPPLRTPSGLRSYRGSGSEKPDLIDFHLCFFIDSDGTFLVSKRIDGQSVGTQHVNVLFTLVMLVCVCVID